MDTIIRKQIATEYSIENGTIPTIQEFPFETPEMLFRPLFLSMDVGNNKARVKTPKISSIAENGLSVENVRKAGHSLWVHHYRAYYSKEVKQTIFLPSGTRHLKDPTLKLLPNGGYTRVTLVPRVTSTSPKLTSIVTAVGTDGEKALEYYGDPLYYTSYCWHGGEVTTTNGGNFNFQKPDLFCYKLGTTKALGRIPQYLADSLLKGTLTSY